VDLEIVQTCYASPEQYDIFITENGERKQIGYLRLRWGHFYAEYPSVGGEMVFEHQFSDGFKGRFDNDVERKMYMNMALDALYKKHMERDDEDDWS